MFDRLRRWRDRRYLARHTLPDALWARACTLPALRHLGDGERARLRELVVLLLRDKSFYGAHDLAVDDWMRVRVATEACLPVLHLPGPHYRDFESIVLYETTFVAQREEHDEIGLVHEHEEVLAGESWDRGPLVLSWADVEDPLHEAANVVLHEFAHKLDGADGLLNGRPPLRAGMRGADWHTAFQAAYDDLCARVDAAERAHRRRQRRRHAHGPGDADGDDYEVDSDIDPYGAEAPEEFFAVCMEAFFMAPAQLHGQYPAVYAQLAAWLAQDPLRHADAPPAAPSMPG